MPVRVALLALVVGLVGMAAMQDPDTFGTRPAFLLAQLALLAPFWLSAVALRLRARDVFAWTMPAPAGLLLSAGCGLALWIAAGGLLQLQYAVWPLPPDVRAVFERLHAELDLWPPWQGALSMAAIAIAPALGEEIAFRGALMGALRRPLGDRAAVVVSAVLFAVIHIPPGGYRVPFILALALVLGALRVRTGSIVPGVIAHAVLNATTVIVTARLGDTTATPDSTSVPAGAAALVLGAAAAAALAFRIPARRERVVHSAE